MFQKKFSTRVRALRKAIGLTQAELGEAIGVTRSLIKHWESEDCFPHTITLITLAKYFNVTVDYLLGLSDDPHKTDITPTDLPNEKIA